MARHDEKQRVILGIKLSQLREEKKMSLQELGKNTGISPSYLNEIEKGKKYPSQEKLEQIAKALGADFEWLASSKLDKKLAPVSDLLDSGILNELPLEMLGLELGKLLELLANTPSKLNAFIRTLIEISRNYNMRVETFYFSVMRSYQEIHDNYFESLEAAAERFIKRFNIDPNKPIRSQYLEKILKDQYNYRIIKDGFSHDPNLKDLRSFTKPGKKYTKLYLNKDLDESQRAFIYGRELGHLYLGVTQRPYTSTWVEINSFEQVLNNFRASYFSNALMMSRKPFLKDLTAFLASTEWHEEILIRTLKRYNATPEMLLQRLTNLLPRYFNIKSVFFLRFTHKPGTNAYQLSKEMHLGGIINPRGTVLHEHYCRRWMFIDILNQLANNQSSNDDNSIVGGAQVAKYFESNEEFLVFSIARPMLPTRGVNSSLSLGIKLDKQSRQRIKFLKDSRIRFRIVNDTCERCAVKNCKLRAAPATEWAENEKLKIRKKLLDKL